MEDPPVEGKYSQFNNGHCAGMQNLKGVEVLLLLSDFRIKVRIRLADLPKCYGQVVGGVAHREGRSPKPLGGTYLGYNSADDVVSADTPCEHLKHHQRRTRVIFAEVLTRPATVR